MISELHPSILALILDMDGVLWRGEQPIGNLAEIFSSLESKGLKVAFATNNSTKTPLDYQQRLQRYGVNIEPSQVITSALATAELLHQRYPQGGPVYVIGEAGLVSALGERGFYPADQNVLAVIVGMDRQLTYEKLKRASLLVRAGAEFIGSNADRTFPTHEGLTPGAGSILAAVETATGVHPIVVGKPQPILTKIALERLATPAQQTLVVGDRLDTDILSGKGAGCRTALVFSGVHSPEDLESCLDKPDLAAEDLQSLLD